MVFTLQRFVSGDWWRVLFHIVDRGEPRPLRRLRDGQSWLSCFSQRVLRIVHSCSVQHPGSLHMLFTSVSECYTSLLPLFKPHRFYMPKYFRFYLNLSNCVLTASSSPLTGHSPLSPRQHRNPIINFKVIASETVKERVSCGVESPLLSTRPVPHYS